MVTTADRPRATGVRRLFFKTPSLLYGGPIASLLAWRNILLLETTGRRSGQRRRVTLSFMRHGQTYLVFAGWGPRADWYRNVQAQPRVHVRIGQRGFWATARPIDSQAERAALMREMAARGNELGPPPALRPLLRITRVYDYDEELARGVRLDGALPVVELTPS